MVVTNWTVTSNPAGKRALKVAGPGSVRMEEDSTWVSTSGYWEPAPGNDPVNGAFAFWSQGRAIRAAAAGASVTIETHCQSTHDIYVGTRLDTNCGIVSASLDRGAPVTLDCYYPAASTSQTRRLLFPGVTAGQHRVEITLTGNKNPSSQGWYFYFDLLECTVRSDVPDPVSTTTAVGIATHFDTDNTYKLSPQRRLLVEAGGGTESLLPAVHGDVLRHLERPGRRVAARRRLGDRQDGVRRARQQQHDRSALRPFHQRDL